jgi:hypothetical protein
MVTRMADGDGRTVGAMWQGTEIFRYVYAPVEAQVESPRPYFHPVRTLQGDVVSCYRPRDHVWHKGISWSLPNVGPANFWGGPTYRRGRGYRQLRNNGRMRHDGFRAVRLAGGVARLEEDLSWVTEPGDSWFRESRRIAALVWPGERAWMLAFESALRNVAGMGITLGSPTTEGRDNAGYGGLFWRGPRSFAGGTVLTPDGTGGDGYMGWRGSWMAYTSRHDSGGRASTLLFRDFPGNPGYPSQWFVRSSPYACMCPSPFFSNALTLAAGESITLRYGVAVADGARGIAAWGDLAELMTTAEAFGSAGAPR